MCWFRLLSRLESGCARGVGDRRPARGEVGDGEYAIIGESVDFNVAMDQVTVLTDSSLYEMKVCTIRQM